MRFSAVLFLWVFSFGLESQAQTGTLEVDEPVHVPQIVIKLPFGKLITFGDMGVKITKIIDSRCPSNVTCIWAGNVIVDYEVYKDGNFLETRKMTIENNREDRTMIDAAQQLKAYSVAPYPRTSMRKIPQEDYVVNLVWERIQKD